MKFEMSFTLKGQCTSGKNAVIVTRTGHRFPAKRFTEWREDMMAQLAPQLQKSPVVLPLTFPVSVEVCYTAKDRVRRDAPGIVDALWHLLEKSGVVSDDTFLSGWGEQLHFINKGVDKEHTGVNITIRGEYASIEEVLPREPRTGRKKKSGRKDGGTYSQLRRKNDDDSNSGGSERFESNEEKSVVIRRGRKNKKRR